MQEFQVKEIIALKNKKTGNFFIYLEDVIDDKVKLINPQAEIIIVPLEFFEDNFININNEDFDKYFSKEQINAYMAYIKKIEEIESLSKKQTSSQPIKTKKIPSYSAGKGSKPENKIIIENPKTSWHSSKLTFYRHYIESLKDNQYFSITVENVGTFKMTKKDFINNFSEVIISEKYKTDGFYTYSQIPEKAYKFLVNT